MIKRIIFDIDNTLIPWKDEYYDGIGKAVLEKLGVSYTEEDVKDLTNAIDIYEQKEQYYNKKKLDKLIRESTKLKLPNDFLDLLLEYFGTCIPAEVSNDIPETLEYLKKKYELVTLTNWFKKEQEDRLNKLDLKKYFLCTYACENFKMKPFAESYETACGNHKTEECLMIGDSIKNDVEGAIKCGLESIYYNPNRNKTTYKNVQSFLELKEIL